MVATLAQGTVEPEQQTATQQTCRDIFSEWSDAAGPGGLSARMFSHEVAQSMTSPQLWSCSDTESLFSGSTPLRLRAKVARVSLLSDVIKPPGKAFANSFLTPKLVRSLFRKHLIARKSFTVLVRVPSPNDLVTVTISFTRGRGPASLIAKSANGLPVCLSAGLRAFIETHAPASPETV